MCVKILLKFFITIGLLINVWCKDDLDLRSDSIVYGLSTINSTVIKKNTLCTKQLEEFVDAANNRTVWALKIIDASGTPDSGFLWGNNFWEGNRVLCSYITDRKPIAVSPKLPVRHNVTENDFSPYSLHFFGAYILQNSAIQQRYNTSEFEGRITLGLCLPATCELDEVKQRLQIYLDEHILDFQRLYDLDMIVDRIKDLNQGMSSGSWLYSMSFKLMLIIFAFLIIMATIGTTYDVKLNKAKDLVKHNLEDAIANKIENKANEKISSGQETLPPILQGTKPSLSIGSKILLAFSLNSNIKTLFKTKPDPSGSSLPFVHGIRFGSMCWVITVHAILFQRDFIENSVVLYKLSEEFYNGPLSNGELCVDSFFFLSGFLVGYLFFKSNIKKFGDVSYTFSQKLLHYMVTILSRYLRFTPTILILIIFAIVNFQYYQDAFLIEIDERVPDNCSKYWWRNILYINNFFAYKDACFSWSWFLSVDMQFLVVTSAILFFSLTHFTAAFFIIVILTISSCLTAIYISNSIKFVPTLDENLNTIDDIYQVPWTRYGPYGIGTLTGYYIVKLNGVLDWKKSTIKLCWVLGPLLNLSILYCLQPTRLLSVPVAALYTGLHRPLWGIGLAWLCIACSTNNAGIINKILSYKGFVPMSRLTTCAYLLNPFLQLSLNLGMEEGIYVGQFHIGRTGFMLIFVTYLTSFLISIFIEMPSYRISKLILFENSQKPNSNSNKDLTK